VSLVIGGDCGGSTTRIVVASVEGRIAGHAEGRAGNPVTRPVAEAAATLAEAARRALGDRDPGSVVGATAGIAGTSRLCDPAAAAAYRDAWRAAGFGCPLWMVPDPVAAYAAGTAAPSGTVLVAGTGTIACEVVDRTMRRRVDGLGWLLGDEGSGFWLGVAAARSVARALFAGAPLGPLQRAVRSAVAGDGALPEAFVSAFYALPRDRVAALAAPVLATDDPIADALVGAAAERLAGSLASLHPAPGPVVLAGGLLTGAARLRDAVQDRLEALTGRRGLLAGDAAAAGAWLALERSGVPDAAALHAALVGPT
jgi:N-acetylglucosamine kinase-like BadF-type ATPase